ncbi:ABC transporter permease [Sphingomonas crocodyli]|uniref:FtsX-like permease family protein n=1 Tax=Sphingomonas crocodyli TaxID=1979270 RepID=A0A437M8T0_9SPHN|nr:FtsX-like permease family protein [Sphingomonas crocodyli]RVT93997.1 FtsX-like permease family protein [Sphingomonas crocodyli]
MSLSLTLALRELRGGMRGLRLLAICLFLGVAALAGVGSLASSIIGELEAQGQTILGADIEMSVTQRGATPEERAAFARLGTISESVRMRAMATREDGSASLLTQLKSIDARWPLYGAFTMQPGALTNRPHGLQAAIAPALADRLNLKPGSIIRVGEARLTVIGLIASEPDQVGEGFSLGPTVLIDPAALAATRLIQPGSLYESRYRIRLDTGEDAHALAEDLGHRFHDANWDVKDSSNAARGLRRFVQQLEQFLTLVGLTALIVAGIGVGNGVASWLDQRRGSIATLKILGASSVIIFRVYLIQVAIVAAGAITAGLIVGIFVPQAVGWLAGDALPVKPRFGLYPIPLITSAIYGLLTALLFSLPPLARARRVPAASMFREIVDGARRPSTPVLIAMIVAGLGIAALAIISARDAILSAGFLAAAAGVFALLSLIGWGIRRLAAALPRPRRPLARLALANLHRPGAQTDRLVVALGLGLTLFVTLAVAQSNLTAQIEQTVPKKAPNFFALDIPVDGIDRFLQLARTASPAATTTNVPSLRGTVVAVRGVRVADMKPKPQGAWILNGDRGLTYASVLPEGNEIVEGKWWPAYYSGPPLISVEDRAALALDLHPGDAMTISVLGVEIETKVASIRRVNWETMGFNFGIIFAPGALEGAPHSYMATVSLPDAAEARLNRSVAATFPSVSLIRVKDVVGQVSTLFGQMATAIRAAAAVAVAAGIAVLIGAIAASRRARIYDAVLLKLLGATRGQILFAQALEYALLSIAVAIVALLIGSAAGWYLVTQLFELPWATDWSLVLATLAIGALGTLGIGLLGAIPALSARPARALRSL